MDEEMLVREAMRVLARRPRRRQRGTCVICGASLERERATRLYCSNACKKRAQYRRLKERQQRAAGASPTRSEA